MGVAVDPSNSYVPLLAALVIPQFIILTKYFKVVLQILETNLAHILHLAKYNLII